MQVSHTRAAVSAVFDDANLIAHAGLVPVMRLAEQCGLSRLVREKVRLTGTKNGAGASADAKVTGIVGGMAAAADSIDDLDVLRHGAMPTVFEGVRAPAGTDHCLCAPVTHSVTVPDSNNHLAQESTALNRSCMADTRKGSSLVGDCPRKETANGPV
ncbi:hypothetical protein [Streptomyces sp. PTD5-9]|uniref:hypothetical protein n=1 Tax=Streptomyces sp. PTD5-9 TaxID=3120150 RepID=UPI003008621F